MSVVVDGCDTYWKYTVSLVAIYTYNSVARNKQYLADPNLTGYTSSCDKRIRTFVKCDSRHSLAEKSDRHVLVAFRKIAKRDY